VITVDFGHPRKAWFGFFDKKNPHFIFMQWTTPIAQFLMETMEKVNCPKIRMIAEIQREYIRFFCSGLKVMPADFVQLTFLMNRPSMIWKNPRPAYVKYMTILYFGLSLFPSNHRCHSQNEKFNWNLKHFFMAYLQKKRHFWWLV
jgi:hypothetical protein